MKFLRVNVLGCYFFWRRLKHNVKSFGSAQKEPLVLFSAELVEMWFNQRIMQNTHCSTANTAMELRKNESNSLICDKVITIFNKLLMLMFRLLIWLYEKCNDRLNEAHMLHVVQSLFCYWSQWAGGKRTEEHWKNPQEVPPFPAENVMNLSGRRRCRSHG